MQEINFTAIDFETANRKRTSACSIGLAKFRAGKLEDTFYELLSPDEGIFEAINMAIHGITPDCDSITKATSFLLVGDQEKHLANYGKPSSKMLKMIDYNARGCSIEILSEAEFLDLAKSGDDMLLY
jgi:hypothetical protein